MSRLLATRTASAGAAASRSLLPPATPGRAAPAEREGPAGGAPIVESVREDRRRHLADGLPTPDEQRIASGTSGRADRGRRRRPGGIAVSMPGVARRRGRGAALLGAVVAALAGSATATATATGTGTVASASDVAVHPWHDAIAEVRVSGDGTRLEVAMRVDAGHLEAAVSHRFGETTDLDRATGGSPDEVRLATYVGERMLARFAPRRGADEQRTPPGDRFDLHWIGRELEGRDCRLHFEWVPPAADPDGAAGPVDAAGSGRSSAPAGAGPIATRPRAVQVRAMVLVEPGMEQVNTVRVLGHGTAIFDAGRHEWTDVDLRMAPRRPEAVRVARAGESGPRMLLVPGPDGAGPWERALAAALREEARVEVAFWPGRDGGPPPPAASGPGGWLDWAARSLAGRLRTGDPPAAIVATTPSAGVLLAAALEHVPVDETLLVVLDRTPPTDDAPAGAGPFARSVVDRYRGELAEAAGAPALGDPLVPDAVEPASVASRVLAAIGDA